VGCCRVIMLVRASRNSGEDGELKQRKDFKEENR